MHHPDTYEESLIKIVGDDEAEYLLDIHCRDAKTAYEAALRELTKVREVKAQPKPEYKSAGDAARSEAKKLGLPALKGTPKQKCWGEQIRKQFCDAGLLDVIVKLSTDRFVGADLSHAAFYIELRSVKSSELAVLLEKWFEESQRLAKLYDAMDSERAARNYVLPDATCSAHWAFDLQLRAVDAAREKIIALKERYNVKSGKAKRY